MADISEFAQLQYSGLNVSLVKTFKGAGKLRVTKRQLAYFLTFASIFVEDQ